MFSGPLVTRQIDHQRWEIVEPFRFDSSSGLVVDIRAGFQTDLASIPAIAQALVSKVGYWSQAAVAHDLLYFNHRNGLDDTITRLQADDILLEGCRIKARDFNVSPSERRDWLIYGGVRAGGLGSWETPEERADRLATLTDNSSIID
jgi:hypothetical protein